MRKRTIFGSILLMTVLASGCGNRISMEEAKKLALEDAGLTSEEAIFTKEQQDHDEFEFRFQTEKVKYEYEIGQNGKIESKRKESRSEALREQELMEGAEVPDREGR